MAPSTEQMDDFLARLETSGNDEERRAMFDTYTEQYDTDVPADPFGRPYYDRQLALYEHIAGKPYTPANEVSTFDVAEMALRPFPYCHGASELVGDQLLAMGFLIKAMRLPQGARILEFGPGWGNTTLILAKMGYRVTAVDIEQNFVDLIRQRAAMEQIPLDVRRDDFSFIEAVEGEFDAILFFECFHHAQDHMRIMAGFDRILAPGGIVCFAAEPITDSFPIPWGLRMDGQSIWAIRRNGWFELGFNSAYFDDALARNGFIGTKHIGSDGPLSKAIIARRRTDMPDETLIFAPGDGAMRSQTGTPGVDGLAIGPGDRGTALYGPYRDLDAGVWRIVIVLAANRPRSGRFTVDVVARSGAVQIVEATTFEATAPDPAFTFFTRTHLRDFEVRVFVDGGCEATVARITLDRV